MGTINEVKNTGEMLLKKFTSNPTPAEGMVIYNTTDKKLRYYDGTAWRDGGVPDWNDVTVYTVYDDFTGANGTAWNATRWTKVDTGQGSGTMTIQTNRGSIDHSIGAITGGSGQSQISSQTIPSGKSIYVEIIRPYSGGGDSSGGTFSVYFGNDTNGWTLCLTATMSMNNPGVSLDCAFGLQAIYIGNNQWKIYSGVLYVTTITLATGTCQIRFILQHPHGNFNAGSGNAIVDNVRYA